ncbi:MAG: ABC transporter permease [Bacteroidetes bacterium 47-18]|nr:MAG: ABC transporter permease [Bacteroidetes bacterium 47-18]
MVNYWIKKSLYALVVLWGIITLIFFLFNIVPSDPARLTLGQRSDLATLENVRKELNLDKSIPERYLLYLNDLSPISIHDTSSLHQYNIKGSLRLGSAGTLVLKQPYLGRSYQTKRPVSEVIAEALPGTVILAVSAMLFAIITGILLGLLAGIRQGTAWDSSAIFTSILGISAPSFFMGLVIAYVFGFLLKPYLGLPMTGSLFEYDTSGIQRISFKNLILPAFTLGIRPMAIIAQLTRSSVLDVLHQDFIRTAYAKGLSRRRVIFRHALPNALNPVITAVSGWFAELLAGSFFIEYIFSWKGLGKLTVDALDKMDFPIVMGSIIVSASAFIIINLLTDLLYAKVDPRIRLDA